MSRLILRPRACALSLLLFAWACGDGGSGKASETEDAGDRPSQDGAVEDGPDAAGAEVDAGSDSPDGDTADAEGPDAETADAGSADGPDLFPKDTLLPVDITMDPDDFAELRLEGRSLNEVFSGCTNKGFSYVPRRSDVTIGGVTVSNVAVQKKGFLGSISVNKPSLRITLDAYDKHGEVGGTTDITLNNSTSDDSFTHQCMSYALFELAGIPAPRCAFAHVTVNGTDMGVYVNVEPVKKPFLKRNFSSAKGDLYEGSVADFRTDMLDGFEKKTNEDTGISPVIGALADALTKPDDALMAALPDSLDVDSYLTFWAMESMLGHWDGYAGDLNNFFIYIDPDTNKIRFLPWGTDNAFVVGHTLLGIATPASVLAWARLPARLYAIPSMRAQYQATLRALLDKVWHEDTMLAEVDRIAALVGSAATSAALEKQRTFIRTRKAAILAELNAATPPEWPVAERGPTACHPELNTALSGTFNTTWGDINSTAISAGNSLTGTVGGAPIRGVVQFGGAGLTADTGEKAIRLTSIALDGSLTVLQLQTTNPMLAAGVVPLHGFETFGVVLTGPSATALAITGFVGDGSIVFSQAGTTAGSPVVGHLDAKLTATAVTPRGANN